MILCGGREQWNEAKVAPSALSLSKLVKDESLFGKVDAILNDLAEKKLTKTLY
jgi:hypothetical protein